MTDVFCVLFFVNRVSPPIIFILKFFKFYFSLYHQYPLHSPLFSFPINLEGSNLYPRMYVAFHKKVRNSELYLIFVYDYHLLSLFVVCANNGL